MITTQYQRWRDKRGTYRPKGEPIDTRRHEVALIAEDAAPKAFVRRHHYAGSYPVAQLRAGLYRGADLVGVAVLSPGASKQAMQRALPFAEARRAELSRLVLLDDVPANGESWFMAQVFALAGRAGFEAVVAYSDPEKRFTVLGQEVFGGHIGGVYQALSARYTGKTNTRTWRFFPDGSVLSDRALTKLRERDQGWRYVAAQLVAHGAPPPPRRVALYSAWRLAAIRAVTTPRRHRGAHRYVWALTPQLRRHLPDGLAYPKLEGW